MIRLALAQAALDIDLGAQLLLGKGEDAAGGRGKPSILSDAFEAVIGAVYLDGGTQAAYDLTRKSGFYDKNPGADMPTKQLTLNTPTANSKGLRFGNFVQGRTVIEEELENVFSGKKEAKAALDDAVKRGNEILRQFEAANK